MKVYILIDAEGISGVVNHEQQVKPDSPEYERMRKYFMSDLNAAIEGAEEAGAQDIIVYDMHYYGLNVLLDELHPKARIIMGKPPKIAPPPGIDESFSALIMIGFHSMAETKGGLLAHTYTLDMKTLHLNGILMGEIGLEAAMAGTRNVPLVLVSGDDAAVKETRALINGVEEACVKYGTGKHSALCLPLSQTHTLIKQKVITALKRLKDFKPYKVKPSYAIEIEFYEESSAQKASSIDGVIKKGAKTIEIKGDNLPALWEDFLSRYTA
jgi:D-amino peptidase